MMSRALRNHVMNSKSQEKRISNTKMSSYFKAKIFYAMTSKFKELDFKVNYSDYELSQIKSINTGVLG